MRSMGAAGNRVGCGSEHTVVRAFGKSAWLMNLTSEMIVSESYCWNGQPISHCSFSDEQLRVGRIR